MANDFNFMDVLSPKQNVDSINSFKRVTLDKLVENEDNCYSLSDIDELADSIETLGLLQPLLVKKNEDNKYIIIAGHRRYNAIQKLIEDTRFEEDYLITIKEINQDEDPIITKLKLHETNLQTRSLLKLPENEQLDIIKDYMEVLDEARLNKIMIAGKPIKGKTREIIAERFQISPASAGKLMSKVKNENNLNTKPNPKKSIFEQFCKKLEKHNEEISEEDMHYIEEIISSLESLK